MLKRCGQLVHGRSSVFIYCLLSKIQQWTYQRTWRLVDAYHFLLPLCLQICLMLLKYAICCHSGQIFVHIYYISILKYQKPIPSFGHHVAYINSVSLQSQLTLKKTSFGKRIFIFAK